jgi:hypothetical protein
MKQHFCKFPNYYSSSLNDNFCLQKTSKQLCSSQRYWVLGLCPSSGFEITKNTTFRKLDPVPSISVCYTPSSEPYSIYLITYS